MTKEQENQLRLVKSYYPFRVVWGKLDKDTGKFEAFISTTNWAANKALMEGHKVWIIS